MESQKLTQYNVVYGIWFPLFDIFSHNKFDKTYEFFTFKKLTML